MCPAQDFRVGLWIQEKALLKEGQAVKGDFFWYSTPVCAKGKESLEDREMEKEVEIKEVICS